MAFSTSTTARWTILSSSVGTPSGRCRPSALGCTLYEPASLGTLPASAVRRGPGGCPPGLSVVPPRLAVDARGSVSLQGEVRRTQAVDVVDVVQKRREPLFPVLRCCLTYPLERAGRALPALCPVCVAARASFPWPAPFPPPPPRPVARLCSAASQVLRSCPTSRVSFVIAVRPWTSRCGLRPLPSQTNVGSPGSRSRCFRACTGSLTARGPDASRDGDVPGVAFRGLLRRRHPEVPPLSRRSIDFAAQYPACTYPGQRFTFALASADA